MVVRCNQIEYAYIQSVPEVAKVLIEEVNIIPKVVFILNWLVLKPPLSPHLGHPAFNQLTQVSLLDRSRDLTKSYNCVCTMSHVI